MKTQYTTWFCLIVYSTILLTSVVRSEYTWNGSEWVWTENESQAPSVPIEEEGSGGDYTYEDEDEGDSWDEGSGDDSYGNVVKKPKHKDTSSSRGNGGYNGGNVYEQPNNPYDPQPNPGYQDPYNPVQDPYGNSWNNNPNPYENQQIPTTKAPWEIDDGKNDIYVDPPVQYPIPSTSSPVDLNPPNNNFQDPSINVSPKNSNRSTSFFAQPGTLAAVIGGAVVGLLCAILCVMFVVYRMRKKDEGSYALDEPKRSPTVNAYAKHPSREFYA